MMPAPHADTRNVRPLTSVALRCQCGHLRGTFANPARVNRALCYCHDCQAFAHVLGQAARVLDERGGSDILQTLPANITFIQGADALACLRLTPKGTLRWYAACCSTPIGNTAWTPKLSFVGLINTFLDTGGIPLEEIAGPVTTVTNIAGARGDPKPKQLGVGRMVAWLTGTMLRARLNGDYRRTQFFRADTGAPAVTPRILTSAEHARVMAAVRQA